MSTLSSLFSAPLNIDPPEPVDTTSIVNGTTRLGIDTPNGVITGDIASRPFFKFEPIDGAGLLGNIGIGDYTLANNVSPGGYNIAIGSSALSSSTTGSFNVGIGIRALNANTTGSTNTAVGYEAMRYNTVGGSNTALGLNALQTNTTGNLNVAVGSSALQANSTGSLNVAVGGSALLRSTTASVNTVVGYNAAANLLGGSFNVAVGYDALATATSSGGVTAIGNRALYLLTTGNDSVAVGSGCGYSTTTGTENTFLGSDAAFNNTTGSRNICIGRQAGNTLVSGSNNIVLGWTAQPSASSVSNEVTIGNTSINKLRVPGIGMTLYPYKWEMELKNNPPNYPDELFQIRLERDTSYEFSSLFMGVKNPSASGLFYQSIGIGYSTLGSYVEGVGNTAIGYKSMESFNGQDIDGSTPEIGTYNTALGTLTLNACKIGYGNVAIGARAMENCEETGTAFSIRGNVAVGAYSLRTVEGINNTAIGTSAGNNLQTGSGNVFLGAGAGQKDVFPWLNFESGDNNIMIGRGAAPSAAVVSNEITIGNVQHTVFRSAVTSITSLSDRRDKTNIIDLEEGLDFVSTLRPVRFDWNTRDGAKVGVEDFGFIAQDLQEVSEDKDWLRLVYAENPDRLEATPGRVIPILVKAIQELKEIVDHQALEIESLKSQSLLKG